VTIGGSSFVGYDTGSSNNSVFVAGASLWTNSGDLSVGYGGSSNSLVISGGASVFNQAGYIGNYSGSSNSVIVSDEGSLWTNAGDLYLGIFGSSNNLVISNGATVAVHGASYGTLFGFDAGSSNNSILVTGTNANGTPSSFINTSAINLGFDGSGNTLTITGGAYVENTFALMGSSTFSSSNTVVVSDAGSLWTNTGGVFVGQEGSGNQITVSNGASVTINATFLGMVIGYGAVSSNNSVVITGTNANGYISSLVSSMDFYAGYGGSSNSLTISGGAQVRDVNGWIGYGASSSNNTVLVVGTNSLWTNSGNITIGAFGGPGNSLTVSDGGQVEAASGIIVTAGLLEVGVTKG
jgi:T5SS/PEP-CTERM-associated repeat protein